MDLKETVSIQEPRSMLEKNLIFGLEFSDLKVDKKYEKVMI